MSDDTELLRCYAETRADAAFSELVRRHVDLVYSAALRQVNGDAPLAQDVTQQVFTDLARKAGSVASHRVLAAWLFTSTRFAAAKAVRGEQRRRAREQEAQLMNEILHDGPGEKMEWERVRPVLDAALARLGEADREAVLLRYFEGRDFAGVGAKLRLSENAARMRVERALDKLHAVLARSGVTSTTGALAAVLTTQAVGAAPAGLAASVAGVAVTGTAAAAAAGTTGAILTFMSMTKLQLGITAALVVAAGVEIAVAEKENTALRAEVAALVSPTDLVGLQAENARLARLVEEVSVLKRDDAEAARLAAIAKELTKNAQAQVQEQARNAQATGIQSVASSPLTGEVFDISKLDQKPEPSFQAVPTYPVEMRKAGTKGDVLVDFVVDAGGKTQAVRAVRSSNPEFEASAIAAVSKWTFRPGKMGGQAVNTHMQVPIVFTISEETEQPDLWF